jgi:hypothetical protein
MFKKALGLGIVSGLLAGLVSLAYARIYRSSLGADFSRVAKPVGIVAVSLAGAFGAKLPLDIEAPELFPGLVVPMHFFPALGWFTLKPLFFRSARSEPSPHSRS